MRANYQLRLRDVILTLTDYHANGAYEKLKANVTLLAYESFAVMIRTTNFESNNFTKNLIYIDEAAYDFLSKSKVYPNDLIMNKIANAGAIYFMPELKRPVSLGMNLFLIRIDESKANPYFIYSYLKKNEWYVKSFASGSTTKTITKEDVRNLKIYLPPLPEQQKIVQILSTWDKAIEKLESLIAAKQKRKKSLMQQLLTGKKRFVGFEEEWKTQPLVKICKIVKGEQLNRDTLSEIGSYPVINGGITPSGYGENFNREPNTITISEGGNSCGFVNLIRTRFWCGGHCYALGNVKIINEYLYHFLKFKEHKIMRLRVGSGLPNIQKKDIEHFHIDIPSIKEQQKIASVFASADKEIETHKTQLYALKQQKKGLMQQLLTGKIRIKLDEPQMAAVGA